MSQKEKRRHLFKVFLHSKALFACFSIVLSLLLVVGSTYAWLTSADERINRSEANRRQLSAQIVEDFSQVFHWAPGTKKTKSIKVRNDGEMPALVRIKLEEFFVSFEVDTADNHREDATAANNINGNANLKIYGPNATATAIDVKRTSTWAENNLYEINANKYYKANHAIRDHTYLLGGARTAPLSAIELNFNTANVVDDITAITGKTDYWFYEDGYFYYSEILDPGEETEELLASVKLDEEYTNQYKGALYKLVPEMDAHDITRSFLTDWEINNKNAQKIYENNERLPYLNEINEGGAG